MVRNVGAVVVGVVVGSIANMLVLGISTLIWPLPEGLNVADLPR